MSFWKNRINHFEQKITFKPGTYYIDGYPIFHVEETKGEDVEMKNKLLPLTKTQQQISDVLYKEIDYMYCNNCRFNSEISEEESIEKYGYWGCEDCHRKYNGWGISKTECDRLAKIIGEIK